MARFPGAAPSILILSFLAAPSARGQTPIEEPQQTFRAAVDLVTIQASVRDRRGRPLKGLSPADFEVRDNGEVRPVLSVRAALHAPISLAILVDMSGSMGSATKIGMVRQAYESLLQQLREDDEVAVLTFDSQLHERQEFTRDLGQLYGALSDFEPFGTTSLYDATAATARKLAARSAAHKAIVVLTDGLDTSSTMTASEVSALASSIDVPVFVVATVPAVDQRALLENVDRPSRSGAVDLRDLAEWTGGHVVFASTFTETNIVASGLISELRQQYVLAIEAAGQREWRRLDIRVKRPASSTVKARSGYFGG
jgi:VWFA-related protein